MPQPFYDEDYGVAGVTRPFTQVELDLLGMTPAARERSFIGPTMPSDELVRGYFPKMGTLETFQRQYREIPSPDFIETPIFRERLAQTRASEPLSRQLTGGELGLGGINPAAEIAGSQQRVKDIVASEEASRKKWQRLGLILEAYGAGVRGQEPLFLKLQEQQRKRQEAAATLQLQRQKMLNDMLNQSWDRNESVFNLMGDNPKGLIDAYTVKVQQGDPTAGFFLGLAKNKMTGAIAEMKSVLPDLQATNPNLYNKTMQAVRSKDYTDYPWPQLRREIETIQAVKKETNTLRGKASLEAKMLAELEEQQKAALAGEGPPLGLPDKLLLTELRKKRQKAEAEAATAENQAVISGVQAEGATARQAEITVLESLLASGAIKDADDITNLKGRIDMLRNTSSPEAVITREQGIADVRAQATLGTETQNALASSLFGRRFGQLRQGEQADVVRAEEERITRIQRARTQAEREVIISAEQDKPLNERAPFWLDKQGGRAPSSMTFREAKEAGYEPVTGQEKQSVQNAVAAMQIMKEYSDLADKVLVSATGNPLVDVLKVKGNQVWLGFLSASGDPDVRRLRALFGAITTAARALGDTANIAVAERLFLQDFFMSEGDTLESAFAKLAQAERIMRGIVTSRGIGQPPALFEGQDAGDKAAIDGMIQRSKPRGK